MISIQKVWVHIVGTVKKRMVIWNGLFQVVWKLNRIKDGSLYLLVADGERMEKMWHLLLQTKFIKIMLQTIYTSLGSCKIQAQKRSKESVKKGYCDRLLKNIGNGNIGQTSS